MKSIHEIQQRGNENKSIAYCISPELEALNKVSNDGEMSATTQPRL